MGLVQWALYIVYIYVFGSQALLQTGERLYIYKLEVAG